MAVIGAIFTPLHNRGKGYAGQMLEYSLDTLGDQGVDLVMLFSDIGAEFYARFGFRLVAKEDPIYGFSEKGIEPAEITIYNHLPAEVQEWDRPYDSGQKFSLLRSPEYYSLLSERISWHQEFMGFKEQKVIVSFADRSYLWADLSRWRMTVRKFGAASDDPERALGRILAAVREKVGFHDFTGWLPQDFESCRFLKLKEKEPRNRTLMMMATLNERAGPTHQLTPDELQFWLADYF
jgi:predicted acetyltransferase